MRARVSVCWHSTVDTHHFTKNTFRTLIIAQVTANDFGSFTQMERRSNQLQARPDACCSYLSFSHPHFYIVFCPGGLHAITIDAKMSQVAAPIPKPWCRWRRISSILLTYGYGLHWIGFGLVHFQVLKRVVLITHMLEILTRLGHYARRSQSKMNFNWCKMYHILTDPKWIINITTDSLCFAIEMDRLVQSDSFASPFKWLDLYIFVIFLNASIDLKQNHCINHDDLVNHIFCCCSILFRYGSPKNRQIFGSFSFALFRIEGRWTSNVAETILSSSPYLQIDLKA